MADDPPMTFQALMSLLPLPPRQNEPGKQRFMSVNPSFCARGGHGAAYGGHVYAQAVWAAAQTVGPGMAVHNVHGFFTLPGLTDRPYVYEVSHLSEGKSYCTRNVVVRHPSTPSFDLEGKSYCTRNVVVRHPSTPSFDLEGKMGEVRRFRVEEGAKELGAICFSCICSFKRDERESFKGHQGVDVKERWKDVLGEGNGSWAMAPGVDAPWWDRLASSQPPRFPVFPGLDIRKVEIPTNTTSDPTSYRMLSLYRPFGFLPSSLPNLHACAHLYASDRNSLFIISNALSFGDQVGTMGSLSHSVVFHVPSEELLFRGDGKDEWWIQEAWTPRSGQGRGLHESWIWSPEGVHVATTWQEGLVRKADRKEDEKQRLLWEEGMRKTGRLGVMEKGKL